LNVSFHIGLAGRQVEGLLLRKNRKRKFKEDAFQYWPSAILSEGLSDIALLPSEGALCVSARDFLDELGTRDAQFKLLR
jgi:hypothetical protein